MSADWDAYIAAQRNRTELRAAMAFIEACSRTVLQYHDTDAWRKMLSEIHTRAEAALAATEWPLEEASI